MQIELAIAGTVTTGAFALNRAKLDVEQKRKVVHSLRAKRDTMKAKLVAESKKAGIKVSRIHKDTELHHRQKAIRNKEYQALTEEHMKAVDALQEARDVLKKLRETRPTKTSVARKAKGPKTTNITPIKR